MSTDIEPPRYKVIRPGGAVINGCLWKEGAQVEHKGWPIRQLNGSVRSFRISIFKSKTLSIPTFRSRMRRSGVSARSLLACWFGRTWNAEMPIQDT